MNYLQEGLKKLNIETVNLSDLETDLEKYIKEQNRYQKEYLDVRIKTEAPHHYDSWTERTQNVIKYAERILECVKSHIKE